MRASILLGLALLCASDGWPLGVRVKDPKTGKGLGVASGDTVLVKFKPGTDKPSRDKSHKRFGGKEDEELGSGWKLVHLPPGKTVEDAMRFYREEAEVLNVEPNFLLRTSFQPTDPRIPDQYALSKMRLFEAWDFEKGTSTRTRVAVIDTGVLDTHQDLSGKVDTANQKRICPALGGNNCAGPCLLSDTAATSGAAVHGTAVASVAGAVGNNAGMVGASWDSDGPRETLILDVNIFDRSTCQNGCPCSDTGALEKAIRYSTGVAKSTGERMVINLSLGCSPGGSGCDDPTPGSPAANTSGCPDALYDAVQTALSEGIVVVAAAGNDLLDGNAGPVDCPAKIAGVIAVGASDSLDNITKFSRTGAEVAVVAPGASILTALNSATDAYGFLNGTSFSSPYTAGVAALVIHYEHRKGGDAAILPSVLTPALLRSRLMDAADDLGEPLAYQGSGRVNALHALVPTAKFGLARLSGRPQPFAAPNPFRVSQGGVTRIFIPVELRAPANEVKIYNTGGDLVRTLSDVEWNGRNDLGEPVASGVYLFVVSTEKGVGRGRVAVIR